MKKERKILHLNRTILFVVMIGYSAFLVLMLWMDFYLIRQYQNENRREAQQAMNSYIEQISEAMHRVDRQLYDVYANDENFQALRKKEDTVAEYGHAYELRQTLYNRMMAEESMNGFFIFYDNMQKSWYNISLNKIRAERSGEMKEQLKRNLELEGKMRSWSSVVVDEDVYLAMFYQKERVAVYGILSLQNIEAELQEKMGKDLEVVFIDREMVLKNKQLAENLELVKMTKNYSDSFSKMAGKHQILGYRIPNTDLWVYAVCQTGIWNIMNVQQLILLLFTVISILGVGGMYMFVKKQVAVPIRQLTEVMNKIRSGETRKVPQISTRFHEIQEVNKTLDEMIRELEKQKMLVYEEIIEKQKAQMQYLQLQLKPHFYLNGLKTLNALAMENQTGKMQELIINLSAHLRYLLQSEREFVPLYMELEFVENYIQMQKHITGRPVNCEITMEEEVKNWSVPVLAVHTFVENSIKYARLGDSRIPLEIQVTASYLSTEEGGYLDLMIQDNGQGYPEDILEEISGETVVGKRNVGINNIKRRCQILYGEKAEYNFASYHGALSELILPEREAEQ